METVENKKVFSWMALLFGAYYYVGYGKILKGFILGVLSVFPFFGIIINIFLEFKAKKELEIGRVPFKWKNTIFLFIVQILVVFPLYSMSPNGQKDILLEEFSGVWETKQSEEVVIDLESISKKLIINNKEIPVQVYDIDLDKKTVQITINNTTRWEISQNIESYKNFTLILKTNANTTNKLYYKSGL